MPCRPPGEHHRAILQRVQKILTALNRSPRGAAWASVSGLRAWACISVQFEIAPAYHSAKSIERLCRAAMQLI